MQAKNQLNALKIQLIFAKLRYLYCIHENTSDLQVIEQLHFDIFWLHQRVTDKRLLRCLIWETIKNTVTSPSLFRALLELDI